MPLTTDVIDTVLDRSIVLGYGDLGLRGAPEALDCTGRFWHDRRPRPTRYLLGASADPPAARHRLWEYCEAAIS